MKNMWVLLATGFGLGYSPVASGTFGTLLGIPLAYALFAWQTDPLIQAVIAGILVVVAIPICDRAEVALGGKKDDGRIVADEYLTYPLTMIGLPLSPVMLGVAFLTHRILDIIKPPPARGLQRLKGGLGVTIDDAISSLYALGLNWLLYLYVLQPRGWL
ncbi:MAG TPA: phosphatidylglycerophosphatase A [Kiritimatiellia bacterium]|nr:phosphatidylglycerophosphatase A [Kiritimatiellia bacterium]HMO98939.1 phosphatidylglycerophosphatase A [Kiritimatiellia bacterium]